MKIIKNINNNVSICLDNSGKELIVFGKGLGFKKPPYEIELSEIERSYYDVDESYISMINEIPETIIKISDFIVNYAREKLKNPISSNIVFTLSDHINFCIKRYEKGMNIKLPILNDIEHLFEIEMDIGNYGLRLIKEKLHIILPEEEAAYIALHIINAEEKSNNNEEVKDDDLISEITKIIESDFNIEINKKDFNYSRFVSHLHYLLKRGKMKEMIHTDNEKLYSSLVENYSLASTSAEKISLYLQKTLKIKLTSEEKMYLILHINRLCSREKIK